MLINKHFPRHHKFYKLFNKNNVKVSYSCMPNMKSIINMHNKKIINPPIKNQERACNCINKLDCPLQQKCLITNTIYKACITSSEENYENKIYYGTSETIFKKQYANHKKSFNHQQYKNDTELSNEYWRMKNENKDPKVTWETLGIYQPYNRSTKRCMLCLNEKVYIALHKDSNILNKRTEFVSKCRHNSKFTLANYDSKD